MTKRSVFALGDAQLNRPDRPYRRRASRPEADPQRAADQPRMQLALHCLALRCLFGRTRRLHMHGVYKMVLRRGQGGPIHVGRFDVSVRRPQYHPKVCEAIYDHCCLTLTPPAIIQHSPQQRG